jgi:hypothetical protein
MQRFATFVPQCLWHAAHGCPVGVPMTSDGGCAGERRCDACVCCEGNDDREFAAVLDVPESRLLPRAVSGSGVVQPASGAARALGRQLHACRVADFQAPTPPRGLLTLFF